MSKPLRSGLLAAGLTAVLCLGGLTAAAENVQYYTLSPDASRVPTPPTYVLKEVIYNAGDWEGESSRLNEPDDLYINEVGELFIADTGNNRIVKIGADGRTAGIFYGPEERPLQEPRGIFADKDGNMYIADTGNHRILHLDSAGEFVEEFVKPDSDLLSEDFLFDPTKITVSPTGYLYVLKGESIMALDAYNRFAGYVGQNKIGFSLQETLIRLFASQSQQAAMTKRRAVSYINFDLDEKGLIYGTAADHADGEIKKLNAVGDNVYRKYDGRAASSFLMPNLIQPVRMFGEPADDAGAPIQPYFTDLAVDGRGIVTAVEQNTCRLYQYDADGQLLTIFGGSGEENGKFQLPSALDLDAQGNLYVLDKTKNSVTIYQPTRFIQLIQDASAAYQEGLYQESMKLWEEAAAISASYQTAYTGMGNALYQAQDYPAAMEQYRLAEDPAGYSAAFAKERHLLFRQHFLWVVLAAVAFAAVGILAYKALRRVGYAAVDRQMNRTADHNTTRNGLGLAAGALFRPGELFSYIKRDRGHINLLPPLLLLALAVVVRLTSLAVTHYPLASADPRDIQWLMEIALLVVPLLSWVVASYAVTAVVGGECRISEILSASCYCLAPYVLFTLPMTGLSNLLSREEAGLYGALLLAISLWTGILFVLSVKVLNMYSIGKTILVCVLSLLAMALLWLTILLVGMLSAQMIEFISNILEELRSIR